MSIEDVRYPYEGATLWFPRLFFVGGALVSCLLAVADRQSALLLFTATFSAAEATYELCIRRRLNARYRVLTTGIPAIGTVLRKRETRRGAVSKLCLRYTVDGRVIESEQSVSPKTYFRTYCNDPLPIRISPSNSRLWLPE